MKLARAADGLKRKLGFVWPPPPRRYFKELASLHFVLDQRTLVAANGFAQKLDEINPWQILLEFVLAYERTGRT